MGDVGGGETSREKDGILAKISNSITPGEFYYVREETTPKAGPMSMLGGSIVVYLMSLGAFVALFIQQSNVRITVTQIERTDISDGTWSCTMLNKVTMTLDEQDIGDDTYERSSFLSLSQSQEECISNINAADPCYDGLGLYSSLNSVTAISSSYRSTFAGVTFRSEDNKKMIVKCSVENMPINIVVLTNYDLMDREENPYGRYFTGDLISRVKCNTLRVDNGAYSFYTRDFPEMSRIGQQVKPVFDQEGSTYFAVAVEKDSSLLWCLNRFPDNVLFCEDGSEATKLSAEFEINSILFTNDNRGKDIYALHFEILYKVKPFVNENGNAILQVTSILVGIQTKAPGSDHVEPPINFALMLSGSNSEIPYVFILAETSLIPNRIFVFRNEVEIQTAYVVCADDLTLNPNGDYIYCSRRLDIFNTSSETSGFGIRRTSFKNDQLLLNKDDNVGYVNDEMVYSAGNLPFGGFGGLEEMIDDSIKLYLEEYDNQISSYFLTERSSFMNATTGGAKISTYNDLNVVAWMTCGAETMDPLLITPASFDSNCKSNGIKWEYSRRTPYTSTYEEYYDKMLAGAQKVCLEYYKSSCENIANLPPYLCIKEEPEDIFSILSTAVANTQLIMSVLIIIVATLLGQSGSSPATEQERKGNETITEANDNVLISNVYKDNSLTHFENPLYGAAAKRASRRHSDRGSADI